MNEYDILNRIYRNTIQIKSDLNLLITKSPNNLSNTEHYLFEFVESLKEYANSKGIKYFEV